MLVVAVGDWVSQLSRAFSVKVRKALGFTSLKSIMFETCMVFVPGPRVMKVVAEAFQEFIVEFDFSSFQALPGAIGSRP